MDQNSLPTSPLSGILLWPRKSPAIWMGKFLIAVVCLIVMWRLLPKGLSPFELLVEHLGIVLVAALLRPVFTFVLALRTFTLTRSLAPRVSAGTTIRATFIGQMANLVLPSGAGCDLVRGTILWRKSQQPWTCIVSVLVLDRFIGTVSLLSFAILLGMPLLITISPSGWLGVGTILAVLSAALVYFSRGLIISRLKSFAIWDEAILAVQNTPFKLWLQATALAFTGHAVLICSYICVFSSMGLSIPWMSMVGIITLSLFLSSLPISLGGHGIREGTLVFLLAAPVSWTNWPPFISMDKALALAAVTWIIHVITNFVGGLIALSLPSQATPAPAAS